jgi:release factor glutamine methyltransferase
MAATVGSLLDKTAAALRVAGYEGVRRHARRLIGLALGLSPSALLAHREREIAERQVQHIHWMERRMIAGEPVTRIIGRREFWGLEFALSADTLDPRPESEVIIEAVLRRLSRRDARLRLLDVGTGTGCLLMALLAELPNATGVAVDLSAGAAATARMNAAALGFASRAHFYVGEWGSALAGRFSVTVANPPYIARAALNELPRAVRLYDPRLALDGGADGFGAYRAIGAELTRLLSPDGIFVAEIGFGQADTVAGIFKSNGLAIDGVESDLAGIARCVVGRPAEPHRGAGTVENPLAKKLLAKKLLECGVAPSTVSASETSAAASERAWSRPHNDA